MIVGFSNMTFFGGGVVGELRLCSLVSLSRLKLDGMLRRCPLWIFLICSLRALSVLNNNLKTAQYFCFSGVFVASFNCS